MKIAFETLGCKLNQAETEALARQFLSAGHEPVNKNDTADIYILNTCTVTHTADSKSRHLLRLARRRNPDALIVVTGCYAERTPDELQKIAGVNLVVPNTEKGNLLKLLQESGWLADASVMKKNHPGNPTRVLRTRAFIKIQDGCTNYCAYCIVPYVRGQEQSTESEKVIDLVKDRVAAGYQEIVLTGTRIGAYTDNNIDLNGLVEHILGETGVLRLRLSSLQPREISDKFISLWHDKRLCPHFHLSLQSGSASVLARMGRHYSVNEYEQAVAMIRAMVPAVAITTDVIVGFPGETDEQFAESLEFCRRMEFARVHVFPYSPRTGTQAATMPEQVPATVKRERAARLRALAQESAHKFQEKFAGTMLDVLWEKQTGEGVWSGMTGNYIRVFKQDNSDLSNKLAAVRVD